MPTRMYIEKDGLEAGTPQGASELKAMLGDWFPITTAPKDGTQILTWRLKNDDVLKDSWYQTSFWSGTNKTWVGWPRSVQPTHWAYLPKPPNAAHEPTADNKQGD